MLVVALRAPLGSLLRDSWFYSMVQVVPYEFGLTGALITTLTILIAIYMSLTWFDFRKKKVRTRK